MLLALPITDLCCWKMGLIWWNGQRVFPALIVHNLPPAATPGFSAQMVAQRLKLNAHIPWHSTGTGEPQLVFWGIGEGRLGGGGRVVGYVLYFLFFNEMCQTGIGCLSESVPTFGQQASTVCLSASHAFSIVAYCLPAAQCMYDSWGSLYVDIHWNKRPLFEHCKPLSPSFCCSMFLYWFENNVSP